MTDETRTERHGNQICTIHNVDGYTTKKTYLGAVHEIGKAIAKIDAGEGELLISAKTEAEAKECLVKNVIAEHGTSYCFELEEVSCASEWDEETEEMKYEDGHFYFHIRFFVWEDAEEAEEQEQEQEAGKMTVAFIANMLKDDFLLKLTDAETGKTYAEKTAGELAADNIQDFVKDWDISRSTIYI